ncbi:phage tail-like protein [Anseongella ginsenosidimutans]|uniref:Phage tail-like protein n=1 Tax=Anseongella ginsenosidimutans TaxID=496056 RepID=A0A4V6NZ24_9SPHI|nr:phage tail protein [Anseongella ginsenosidimutans]QEC53864.1 phage tail protein [Anseongella ginsenosidimutans]TCS86244.1 phage tail-like protein [Anseongella ginsenosidimutans]
MAIPGTYPLTGFHFVVAFELFPQLPQDFRFQEVSGLSVNMEMEPYREGGQNRFEHQLPVKTSYTDLTLKRGMFELPSGIMAWCINAVQHFEFQPTNLLVSLLNDQHIPVQSWYVVNAIPKSVEFSSLNAEQSQVAIETLVLSYNYFNILNQSAGLAAGLNAAAI